MISFRVLGLASAVLFTTAASGSAQVTVYYPPVTTATVPAAPVTTYYGTTTVYSPSPQTVYSPAPVVSYSVPVAPTTVYAPVTTYYAPAVTVPPAGTLYRPVYVPGQPLRNVLRGLAP